MFSPYASYDSMFVIRMGILFELLVMEIFQDRLKSVPGFIPRLKYGGFNHFPVIRRSPKFNRQETLGDICVPLCSIIM